MANAHNGGSSAVFASGNATNYVSRKGISDNLINKIDLMKEYKKSDDNSAWKKYRKKGTYTGNYKNMTLTTPWGSKMSFDKKKGSANWNT